VVAPHLPPLPVATIGLHGSASTWVFNIVRELLAASLEDTRVVAFFAEDLRLWPEEAARENVRIVIKAHRPGEELLDWLAKKDARLFLSIRDPRDASISMSQRFATPLQATVGWLAADCRRMSVLAASGRPVLRYEDRFFEDPRTVADLAAGLGLAPAPETIAVLFDRYRAEKVRSIARGLRDSPRDRVAEIGPFLMDKETQILEPHIGDTLSDKWRRLPVEVQVKLTSAFAPFLEQFGYPL
jgi:hypothetical protein